MAGHSKTCDARGGMIRITCSRCNKTRYFEVAAGTRRRVVRCQCGLSGSYTINYRSDTREQSSSRAHAVLANAHEALIRLCDTSASGVGFLIPREYAHSLHKGQEIRIKFRGSGGSFAQRRIRIRNITGNRIGAQYA